MSEGEDWTTIRYPVLISTAVAGYFALHFRQYLPVAQEWRQIESVLAPLTTLDAALHKGGVLLELGVPVACLAAFMARESRSGAAVILFWIGEILLNAGWYAADAKGQALLLLTGRQAGRDWAYWLGTREFVADPVVAGQALFFSGAWLMVFSLLWFLVLMRRYFKTGF